MLTRFRATLEYDGTAYHGFQRQVETQPSIQGTVETAVAAVTGQTVTVIGAGRTDTGVHAEGQVIAFDVHWTHSDTALLRALNANLPDDIALRDLVQQSGFHPRYDAVARQYRYHVLVTEHRQPLSRLRTWQMRGPLDRTAMQSAADMLIGEHDFAAFGTPPKGDNTVRTVYRSEWTVEGGLHLYRIEANAFLYHMVRRIVGMLVEVGRGTRTLTAFEAAFNSDDLAQAKTLAPAHGLVLEAVRY